MSKRKYSPSSSDDCDPDDDDSVFSSSSREREELKTLFCNYIDRLSRKRKATKKRKVFTELVQSFSELPFPTKKKNQAKAKKNIQKYHQRAASSDDEKTVLQKQNLRSFFEGRISKLCQAHAMTCDFKSNPSTSSDSPSSRKRGKEERIDNLKSQSSKLILKEKFSNKRKQELVKKWKNEHFEKPSADGLSEHSASKALHKHANVTKDMMNSSRFSSSSSSSLLLSPSIPKTNVQEASRSRDDCSSNVKVFVSSQTRPTDSNDAILSERNSSEKSTPVLQNAESLDDLNSKPYCINSQVDKMNTLGSGFNETHNISSGVDKESNKNSSSKESSVMKLDSDHKGIPNSDECLVGEAEDFDAATYIESKEKKAKNKKAKSKHKSRHKTKSSRDEDIKKKSQKSQSKKLDKKSTSKSTKLSRSRSREARLKSERTRHNSWRGSRSNSRPENSRSRSRERQKRTEKAMNQLEVHSSKYSRHEEDRNDYESRYYRDEERHEKKGRARPSMKRVRNFLSLDSSVEEVFSNNENADDQVRVNSSVHDISSSSEASSRVEVAKKIHSRWSQSSDSDRSKASSTWRVDLENQKPIQRRHDSQGKYEFKKKSSSKIRERLRQPCAVESSADETEGKKIVINSSGTKHPKVAIDLQDLFPSGMVSERKNCKESKTNKELKMVSECKSKNDDMTKGSKGSTSATDADKADLDLGVRHNVYISNVPSLKGVASNQDTGKLEVNSSSTTCQNISKDPIELNSLGRAPLRISFKPRAVLKNVNKLAEASIKFASSKFNSLYEKKSTKNDDNVEDKLSTSGSKTPPGKMIVGSPLSTAVHKIISGEKRSDRSIASKENEARSEKRVVLNSQSKRQENGNDRGDLQRKDDERSRHRVRSSCDSIHSARSSRSTEHQKSMSRRRIGSSSSSRRSYSSRSRGRSWRRGRSRTYSSRRSYRSISRSRSRSYSRRRRYFRRDRRSTYSSRDSSRRNYHLRSRSRSRRRRRTYSSRSSSRGGGCRRLRSYRDWSSFSSRDTSRSRSSRWSYSRSGSRRKRLSERKNVGKRRSESDSPRRTSSESLTADSDASSKDDNAEKSTKEGNLVYECGDVLHDRYEILSTLGTGTFSKVVQCVDLRSDKHVALKIIKNIPKYREAAELEISILKDIATKDPNDENFCIRMHSTFEHLDHWCLVFDSMGLNLYEFLKNNSYQPYTMDQIRHIGFQLVKAVKFLHGIGLMHTDLKPENVLFVNSDFSAVTSPHKGKKSYHLLKHTDIRLIDFGSAVYDHETHEDVVSTRQYRAVEVILEIGWNRSCDIWSVGCILFEMYAGHTLFQTHSNLEHLAMMEVILGPLPSRMIRKTEKNYFSGGRLKWDSNSREGRNIKKNCKPFKNYMSRGEVDHHDLFELMLLMLTYEPQDRITAEKALEDRFFARFSGRR